MFIGPIPKSNDTYIVSTILKNHVWDWTNFGFDIPTEIESIINKQYISIYAQQHNQLIWGLTTSGKFTIQTMY